MLSLEELQARGIMDERDKDYLDHLNVYAPELDKVVMEGVFLATKHMLGEVVDDLNIEMKGWMLGLEAKRKYIEDTSSEVIEWLKIKQAKYPNLDLEMNAFKTWLKTSEAYSWRYYFLLEDSSWRKIVSDLKNGNITGIEVIYDINFNQRKDIARYIDSVKNIDGLIKLVELYISRSNIFFNLIAKRKLKVQSTPFQIILMGVVDLRRAVKKIVNLAMP